MHLYPVDRNTETPVAAGVIPAMLMRQKSRKGSVDISAATKGARIVTAYSTSVERAESL